MWYVSNCSAIFGKRWIYIGYRVFLVICASFQLGVCLLCFDLSIAPNHFQMHLYSQWISIKSINMWILMMRSDCRCKCNLCAEKQFIDHFIEFASIWILWLVSLTQWAINMNRTNHSHTHMTIGKIVFVWAIQLHKSRTQSCVAIKRLFNCLLHFSMSLSFILQHTQIWSRATQCSDK